MKTTTTICLLILSSLYSLGADYAVTFYNGDPTGIPDGWPATKRELAAGEQLRPGETFVTGEALAQIVADKSAVMDARNRRIETKQLVPLVLADQLRQRLAGSEFQALKVDALQSELAGILANVILKNTELLLLTVQAVAGTSATNNLSGAQRARVQTLRSELQLGTGNAITAADKQRYTDIKAALTAHYQLYLAAKAIVDAWQTNAANAPDPYSLTNLPNVNIAD